MRIATENKEEAHCNLVPVNGNNGHDQERILYTELDERPCGSLY